MVEWLSALCPHLRLERRPQTPPLRRGIQYPVLASQRIPGFVACLTAVPTPYLTISDISQGCEQSISATIGSDVLSAPFLFVRMSDSYSSWHKTGFEKGKL